MARSLDRRLGTVVGGRYRLVSIIGSGGMGIVYRAEHLLLKKEVALKLLHSHLRGHQRAEEMEQRFLREAQSLARLDQQHPNLVQIIDCGIGEDGALYMAMELCEGEPLCDVIARGPVPPSRALHVVVQVLRALVHAHGKGIVHRDLKPDNVMLVRRDGREDFVKILDFGIAKLLSETELGEAIAPELPAQEAAEAGPKLLTQAGVIFGTPEYLAPEQAQGREVDQRTDLYAVGVMLWELLVGYRPLQGDTPLQTISLHLTALPDPPSRHCTTPLPAALDEVVLKAMAKDPAERYASAEGFLRGLDVALAQLSARRTTAGMAPLWTGLRRAMTGRMGVASAAGSGEEVAEASQQRLWLRRELSRGRRLLREGLLALSRGLAAAAERVGIRGTALAVALVVLVGMVAIMRLATVLVRRAPEPAPVVQKVAPVPVEDLVKWLEYGRTCEERRSAALALMARRDGRALEALERAQKRGAVNRCMAQVLEEAIAIVGQAAGRK